MRHTPRVLMTAAIFHLKIAIFVISENSDKNYILTYFFQCFGVLLSFMLGKFVTSDFLKII